MPVTTVDLGNDVAAELAAGGMIKGVAAQRPYDQGVAAGTATILALIGKEPPTWMALSGIEVVAANVLEAYQIVWHAPAPKELMSVRRKKAG